jgi:hypothetical protein
MKKSVKSSQPNSKNAMKDKVERCGMRIPISAGHKFPVKLGCTSTDYLLHSTKALSIQ